MRRLSAVLVALLVCVGVAACGSDDEPVETGDGPAGIEGDYVAIDVTEDGEPRPLVEDTELTLRLKDGQVSASAGCNSIGGAYELVDGELRTDALAMTEMGCDDARSQQDAWVADLLSSAPTVESVDQGLVLRTDSTTIEFVERSVAHPDRDLVGTTWQVTGFVEGTGPDGVASTRDGDMGRIVLADDGTVSGADGCNEFGSTEAPAPDGSDETIALRHRVDGDEITFDGAPVTTLRGCGDVDVGPFWAVLDGTVRWEIDGDRLTLMADDGRGVTYEAVDG